MEIDANVGIHLDSKILEKFFYVRSLCRINLQTLSDDAVQLVGVALWDWLKQPFSDTVVELGHIVP